MSRDQRTRASAIRSQDRRRLKEFREGGSGQADRRDLAEKREQCEALARFHLRENVSRADEELTAQIADAPAPFWGHVRDALDERRP